MPFRIQNSSILLMYVYEFDSIIDRNPTLALFTHAIVLECQNIILVFFCVCFLDSYTLISSNKDNSNNFIKMVN